MIFFSHGRQPASRNKQQKEEHGMNMSEASRLILGLRAAGWDEKTINDFILWIETGNEKYKPEKVNE
jgi:hypothetical protein